MNRKLKIVVLACLLSFVLYALGGKFIASVLESSSICHSSNLYESQKNGFFRTFYELTDESKKMMDSLNLRTDTIWTEKLHGYSAGYFGVYSKKELNYLSLAFPVQNILTKDIYLFYDLELDSKQRLFTSGYDIPNNRYNFSPKYLEDTLYVLIKRKDSVESWRKPNRVGTLTLVRQ